MTISIFVAGDLHIPSRAFMLHPQFQLLFEQQKWDYIVLTGDYTLPEVLERFRANLKNSKNLIACRGNMDLFPLPEKPTFEVYGHKFGVFHGTGVSPRGNVEQLKEIANDMKVRILFTGHTHKRLFFHDEEHIILNPGTSTGASGGSAWTVDTGIIIAKLSSTIFDVDFYYVTNRGKLRNERRKINLSLNLD